MVMMIRCEGFRHLDQRAIATRAGWPSNKNGVRCVVRSFSKSVTLARKCTIGCDIHPIVEMQGSDGKWSSSKHDIFDCRNYEIFAFLAGVRNYSDITPLAEARGLPEDGSNLVKELQDNWSPDYHHHSWLSVGELLAFDYDQPVEDRRVTRVRESGVIDHGCTAEPGGGTMTTYRELLGDWYFRELHLLAALNEKAPTRVVFWFDS